MLNSGMARIFADRAQFRARFDGPGRHGGQGRQTGRAAYGMAGNTFRARTKKPARWRAMSDAIIQRLGFKLSHE